MWSGYAVLFALFAATVAADEIQGDPESANHDVPGFVVGVIEEGSPEWTDVQDKLLDVMPEPEVLVRSRFVRIDANWFIRSDVPEELKVEFFDDFTCYAVKKSVRDGWNNNWIWRGTCDPWGEQTISIIKSPMGFINVTLVVRHRSYGIKFLRGSTHVVWEVDLTKMHLLHSSG